MSLYLPVNARQELHQSHFLFSRQLFPAQAYPTHKIQLGAERIRSEGWLGAKLDQQLDRQYDA